MTTLRLAAASVLVFAALCSTLFAQPATTDKGKQITGLIATGKLEAAVDACNAWAKEDALATHPHFLLAEIYTRLRKWERAQEELEVVLDLNPASASAYVKLGDLFRAQHAPDKANGQYHKALAVDPKCVEGFIGLVRTALEADKPEEADAAMQTLRGLAPESPAVLALAGEMAGRAGNAAEATASFTQALEKDPKCADALYGLAVLTQAQRTPAAEAEAQKLWDRFLEVEGDGDRAWQVLSGLVPLARRRVPSCPGRDERPDISPDGKHVATGVQDSADNGKLAGIWVMPLDGGAPPKQIVTGGGAVGPRWTADGRSVLFDYYYADRKSGKTRVFVAPADGSAQPVCLTPETDVARIIGPLPGTARIAYTDVSAFWTMNPDGSDKQRLPTVARGGVGVEHARLSPDGKSVVYMSKDWNDKRRSRPPCILMVSPLDGSLPPRSITPDYDSDTRQGAFGPTWAPDARRIAYSSDEQHPKRVFDMFVQVVGDPHPPVCYGYGQSPVWTPDGTGIAYFVWTREDPGAIFVLELGGRRLPIVKP